MQFEVTTDLAPIVSQEIEFNYESIKQNLARNLEKYKGMVVMEDKLPDAKKTRADLRKLRESIGEARKNVKREWMKPYDVFAAKCNELEALCDAPILEIDTQVKAFEERKKKEKQDRLQAVFKESVGETAEYCTWDYVFDPKWLNATVSESAATEQMQAKIKRCADDVALIKALKADAAMEAMMLDHYQKAHDVGAAMAMYNRVREREEAEKARTAKQSAAVKGEAPQPRFEAVAEAPEQEPQADDDVVVIEMRFYIPKAVRVEFGEWCHMHGVRYERI